MKQGYLGSFFGGVGRVDLAMAAAEAARFPDLDRALDQLLAKLPTQALQHPRLQAEPSAINLGQIKINENRSSELHLTNLGMRILYGTVTSDCKWLTLGDGAGHAEKMFQFGAEAIIPVQVRGQHLRAGSKPLEGKLVIDSNGGTTTVIFKADVPITPFPGGMFSGAVTPRQIAEKAKAAAKLAAPSFEKWRRRRLVRFQRLGLSGARPDHALGRRYSAILRGARRRQGPARRFPSEDARHGRRRRHERRGQDRSHHAGSQGRLRLGDVCDQPLGSRSARPTAPAESIAVIPITHQDSVQP